MAIDSTVTQGYHLQARRPTLFRNVFNSAFTLYVDVDVTPNSTLMPFAWIRKNGGFYAGISSGNKLFVSEFVNTRAGSTTITSGRWRFLFIWNGTTIKAWARPDSGSVTQEINGGTFSPGSISEAAPGIAAGARETNSRVNTIHDWCLWDAAIDEIHTETLLVAGTPPILLQPEDIFWKPPMLGEGDASQHESSTSPCVFSASLTGAPAQNISVLKDPETHAPISFSGTYYAVGNDSTEDDLELYSSTNLTAWTYVEDITTTTAESLTNLGACDFIYDAGASRPYQVLYWAESGGNNTIRAISTASMSSRSWVNETNNPLFSVSDLSGRAAGDGNGAEDFRVTKDAAGDWVAVFEVNDEETGNQVGIARNQSDRLADAFTWTGDMLDGLSPRDLYRTASDLWANPVICKLDGVYYCFWEHRTSSNGNHTYFAKSEDPSDPASWVALGGAAAPRQLEGGVKTGLFPNGSFISGGEIHLLTTGNERWIYKGVDTLFVPGYTSYPSGAFQHWVLPEGGSGGDGVSLTPGAGATAAAGNAPVIEAGIGLAPGSGGAPAAGGSPGLAQGADLGPGAGDADAGGGRPGVDTGQPTTPAEMSPGAGGAAAAGGQPSIDTGGPAVWPGRMVLTERPVAWMHLWEAPLQ